MAKLILGMGLPGAGKSTILKKFAEKHGYEYISVDDIRREYGLTPQEPSTEREWDHIRSRALESYAAGKTAVLDGTLLGDIRVKFINFAREHGIQKIQGLLIDTPAETAWERNTDRKTNAPREVFEDRLRHLKNFPPEISDGFDSIFYVDENGELTKAESAGERTREFKFR